MQIRSVGIVGYGAFGAFLARLFERFAPETDIRLYSSRHQPDGERFYTLEDACKTDAVILAVSIAAFEETLKRILPLLAPETTLVDVATVKGHTSGLLRRLAPNRRYLATHPMFGPESYEKRGEDVAGFRIVVVDHTLPSDAYIALKAAVAALGFDIVEMSAEQHDKHLAETLFLTHFIGQTIVAAEFTRTEIDTVSFGYLMDAVESVKNDAGLFRDVYRFVPYCKQVIARLEDAEKRVQELLGSGTA